MTINIKFPIEDDSVKNNFLQMTEITKDGVSSNLLLLLLTQKGERYYQPDYGCDLLKFVFEQNDSITEIEIEDEIKKTVSRYLPKITIDKIYFYSNVDEYGNTLQDNRLNLKILFTYSDDIFSETGELDLNF
jgi:phage baseplate assembly protein W